MGEAKARGTFEERKALAIRKDKEDTLLKIKQAMNRRQNKLIRMLSPIPYTLRGTK